MICNKAGQDYRILGTSQVYNTIGLRQGAGVVGVARERVDYRTL